MGDPISAGLMGGVGGGLFAYHQKRQAEKQQEAMEKAMRRNEPPPPKRPEKQAKYSVVRSSTSGPHRNLFTAGPFVPPSVTRLFGSTLGGGGSGKKMLGE